MTGLHSSCEQYKCHVSRSGRVKKSHEGIRDTWSAHLQEVLSSYLNSSLLGVHGAHLSILLHVSVQIFLRHIFPTHNCHGLGNDPCLAPFGYSMGLHDSQYPNTSDLSVWICQYCSTRSDWNQHDSCPQCSVCTRGRRRQTEKTVKDSTNYVLEMDHDETFPAIYLGQDVDICFCEENDVTEVVVSHKERGKLRMAMDEFQSKVSKREMVVSCYAQSDFTSSTLDEDYEPSAYLARLIKSTFPWLKTAKKKPKKDSTVQVGCQKCRLHEKVPVHGR